jgi:hypothetical protein
LKKRRQQAEVLRGLVQADLERGILPGRKEKIELQIIANRIDDAKKCSYDEAIDVVKKTYRVQ